MAYAVIKTGGKQYRVSVGDLIDVEKLDVEIGTEQTLSEVLLVGDGDNVRVGAPRVEGVSVTAEVKDQYKDKKIWAFKFTRRQGYKRKVGHRRLLTRLEIKSIVG